MPPAPSWANGETSIILPVRQEAGEQGHIDAIRSETLADMAAQVDIDATTEADKTSRVALMRVADGNAWLGKERTELPSEIEI